MNCQNSYRCRRKKNIKKAITAVIDELSKKKNRLSNRKRRRKRYKKAVTAVIVELSKQQQKKLGIKTKFILKAVVAGS